MATKVGSLIVSLALESGSFKSGLDKSTAELRKAEKHIREVGQNMADLGKGLSLAVTVPMIAIGRQAIAGFVEQEKAMADVRAALQSMGTVSGKTADELARTADALEMRSLFDAEVILKQVSAQLLTFGNVAGEQFDRAQQAAVDMATRLGGEPQAAAIALGKALNDPIKGVTALTRVGVQFTEAQKAQIKAMTDAGNIAGAQGVILNEVEKQFRGAGAAAADASPWRKAQVAIGQAMDQIGKAILPIIKPVTEAIISVAHAFTALPEPVQKAIVVMGVLATVLGPVLIALGGLISLGAPLLATLGAAGTAVSVLATGFQLAGVLIAAAGRALLGLVVTNPVLAALAAAATAVYLAWKNWDKIKGIVAGVGSTISDWWSNTVSPVLGKAWDKVKLGATVWFQLHVAVAQAAAKMVTAVRDWLVVKLDAVWDWVKGKIALVKKAFFDLYDAVVGNSYIPDMVDGIADHMKRLDQVMVGQAEKATGKTRSAFQKLAEDVMPILDRLFPEQAARNQFNRDFAAIEAAQRGGVLSRDAAASALDRLQDEFRAGQAEPATPASVLQLDGIDMTSNALAQIGSEIQNLSTGIPQLAGSFNSVWDAIGVRGEEVTRDLARGLTDVVLHGRNAVDMLSQLLDKLATAALDNLFSGLLTSIGLPGFASGTSFAPGGLAVVGERGPEIVNLPRGSQVIPNGESSRMLRERSVTHAPTFVFSGITNPRDAREAAGQAARRYRAEINGPTR